MHFKSILILLASSGLLITSQSTASACEKPNPGKYWLGWGTARLIVPSSGRPYQTFRGQNHDLPGKYCKSGDNSGVTRQEENGKIWAYTKSPD